MGSFEDILDWIDEDFIFLIKYGLIIANTISIFIILYFKKYQPMVSILSYQEVKQILIVTAHPDDEAMFFIPTIENLKSQNYNIHLLCLTNGNFNKIGKLREIELEKCCKYLQIKCTIINDIEIEDSMTKQWPLGKVTNYFENYVKQNDIKGIITFDQHGISGHINHISCYQAVTKLKNTLPDLKLFQLESTNIIRKYISIIDFFISAIASDHMMIQMNPIKVWRAMAIHHSQFVWYRRLFVIFSRYSYINTLKAI